MRIRSHLLLLTIVVLVPGFMAAVVALAKVREGERDAALRGLHETVRATTLLVDGQIQRSLGTLSTLAHSSHLQSGDFAALYQQAAAVDQTPDVWTVLLDDTGAERFNTAVPFGTTLPPPLAGERVAPASQSRGPLVSDLMRGPVTGKLLTRVYVPAKATPSGQFVIAHSFSVDYWNKIGISPDDRSHWIVAVLDRKGRFIWRSHRAAEYLGREARPELVAAAAASSSGMIRHSTLEGIDSYDAFTHSAISGWTIAVAAPVETIEASATYAVIWLGAAMATALGLALLGATLLSRILLGAIDTASSAARALGRGQRPDTPGTAVREVNALNTHLGDAARLLATERAARESVERHREQLLENERVARQVAQDQNRAKDQFLALLGHELRNPLAAIAGASAVLAKGPPDAETRQRFLDIIQRQNRHLRRIVDDLLDASRMLSGKLVLSPRALNLGDCVRGAVESVRATERAHDFRWDVRTEDVWVDGDAVRLEQIVYNLLSNALNFSPPNGEVSVVVCAQESHAIIEVSDCGPGIPPELVTRLFDPFVQGPPPPGRQSCGLGIGLALVKQLVELHGGSTRVHSNRAGAGSTFEVRLPRIAAPPPAANGRQC